MAIFPVDAWDGDGVIFSSGNFYETKKLDFFPIMWENGGHSYLTRLEAAHTRVFYFFKFVLVKYLF